MTLITDIHAHLLPGIDDGPEKMEDAIQMMSEVVASKTDRIIATSHYLHPHWQHNLSEVYASFLRLRSELVINPAIHCRVEVAFGVEIQISSTLLLDIRNHQIPSLAESNYVLLELSSLGPTRNLFEVIHELRVQGYKPILAHPERSVLLRKNPAVLDHLMDNHVLFQVTASSFLEMPGVKHLGESGQFAWKLLDKGMVHFIASDTHNTTSRPPGLLAAYDQIAIKKGDLAAEVLINNANAVWDNYECENIVVPNVKRNRWFSWLRG